MKKFIFTLFFSLFFILPMFTIKAHAIDSDYLAFIEIIMSTGKLARDFTEEERKISGAKSEKNMFYGISVHQENIAVKGTYISSILVSYENSGTTDIEFTKEIQVETNQKTSFSTGGDISGTVGFSVKKIKAEIAGKANVKYASSSEKSVKEKKTMKLKVEANSRMILYLTGDLQVSNGSFSIYNFWVKLYTFTYEFVTLNTQYERLEKALINENLKEVIEYENNEN